MNKFFQNRTSRWLMAGILFFLSSVLLSQFFDFQISRRYYQKKVNRFVLEEQEEIEHIAKNLLSHPATKPKLKQNIFYAIYRDTVLKSWSSNKFPFDLCDSLSTEIRLLISDEGIFVGKFFHKEALRIYVLSKIKNNYPFENEYLKNTFVDNVSIPADIVIRKEPSPYALMSGEGNHLGWIHFGKARAGTAVLLLIYIFWLLAMIYWSAYLNEFLRRKASYVRLIAISALWFMAGYMLYRWGWYALLQRARVFQPESFAYTGLFPSIGHVLTFLSYLLVVLLLCVDVESLKNKPAKQAKWAGILSMLSLPVLLILFTLSIEILIKNSSIELNIKYLIEGNTEAVFAFTSLTLLLANFLLLISFVKAIYPLSFFKPVKVIGSMLTAGLILWFLSGLHFSLLVHLLVVAGFLLIFYLQQQQKLNALSSFLALLLLLSTDSAFLINKQTREKELSKRQTLIQNIALNQDPELEYLFSQIERQVYSDSTFIGMVYDPSISAGDLRIYLYDHYFTHRKRWERYDIQITLCDQSTELIVKPDNLTILCKDYFYNTLIFNGSLTSNNNLYLLDYGVGQINYLGLLRFHTAADIDYTFYIEINSKIKRKGFSKLLSPSGMDPFEKVREYAMGRYREGQLLESYGDYSYKARLKRLPAKGKMWYYHQGSYSHILYRFSEKDAFILSLPEKSIPAKWAPFAYEFLLFIMLAGIFSLLFNKIFHVFTTPRSFSFRLQAGFISLLTVTLVLITLVSSFYIKKLNEVKDEKTIKDIALSLQKEFEHKLANSYTEEMDFDDYLSELSYKFSSVFNSDITLYDLQGKLLSTTRPRLFQSKLLSDKINPQALNLLSDSMETFIILEDRIGKLKYYSAYMPFHNAANKTVAYLNLPYFARQDQLHKEVSNFLITLVNIYTFVIVLSVLAVILLSGYIIRPMRMIREKMQKISIGGKNEYIRWNRDDEIGQLVEEYNRMVDELARSANLLARSERESAWRQMARQVAHEIKNPLTPMKLSVQYLIKAIDDRAEDVEERIKSLSRTLIEQIDTLAEIASAFSDFAKMPANKKEENNLLDAVEAAVKLFKEEDKVDISIQAAKNNYPVFSDNKNLIRVFNNLIKNAIQSFPPGKQGRIIIEIEDAEPFWKISVSDNGSGIPLEEQSKIFLPNFTTKSSGMGLGLAMVKNIVLAHEGDISFESTPGKGTTFVLYIKKKSDE